VREHDSVSPATMRRGRRKFDDDEPDFLKRGRLEPLLHEDPDLPETGDAWSTWDGAEHGPEPRPDWVRTEHGATDTELGMLKTGKEADVFLVRRAVPDTDKISMLAAKRYRDGDHRLFHRDAGYLEGRRVRRSREMRAMTNRSAFGKEMIAGQWAAAEFGALSHLWEVGRRQMTDALSVLARAQVAHGDLSPYNTLVDGGRLVLIDLPQIVDVIANPQGADFIARDVRNVAAWFAARGVEVDADALLERLLYEAGLR
jgi:RIO kinase 1